MGAHRGRIIVVVVSNTSRARLVRSSTGGGRGRGRRSGGGGRTGGCVGGRQTEVQLRQLDHDQQEAMPGQQRRLERLEGRNEEEQAQQLGLQGHVRGRLLDAGERRPNRVEW